MNKWTQEQRRKAREQVGDVWQQANLSFSDIAIELACQRNELLEALKAARIEIKASGNWDKKDFGWPAVKSQIEAAIAKAEGAQ